MPHGCALAELEHERNVLDQQPARALLALDQTEHLVHQARACTGDACGLAGLREVLAGETGGHQFDVTGQRTQFGDVTVQRHVGETRTENCLRARIDFTQQFGVPPMFREPQLETTDTGKQTHHAPRRRHSTLPHEPT